jgi:UDP-glucose 4-epimerase
VADAVGRAGLTAVGLDLADRDDVTDPATVRERMRGCSAVVHLAAVDDEPAEPDPLTPATTGLAQRVWATNVGGTSQVLAAAAAEGIDRLVFLSSVDVLGCFMGQGTPRYLPIDDSHPVDPKGPYAWSKLAGEEMCEAFTRATGIPTICLRPPGLFNAEIYTFIKRARSQCAESEWSPIWEYGAFLDVRDLATAVIAGLTVPNLTGHHRLLVCANDISSATEDSLTLARRLTPNVPLTGLGRFTEEPFSALIDSSGAQEVLQWHPAHSWRS